MDDSLIDTNRLSIERKSMLPGAGFFRPDEASDEQARQEVRSRLAGAATVVIADPDADGLACVALVRAAHDDVAFLPASPHELRDQIAHAADAVEPGTTVYLCDLCPDHADDLEALADLVDQAGRVAWYDHHEWTPALADSVRETDVALTVGDSDTVCSADVTRDQLSASVPDRLEELVAVTRDHDLWIREDDRSDDLADYAHWAEPETYIETVLEHGPALPADAQDLLAERRVEKQALIDRAVDRATFREIGPWTVGITYGRCSQNEVAERLRANGADAAVIVKPAGSASLRGTEAFSRCHDVAAQVNGGGHPKAAGCKPAIYDDMLDYAHHWTTEGAVAKRVILAAFRRLAAASA